MDDVLKAIGQPASLIFAAWIFLSYLQQRYSGAFNMYRSLVDAYRHGEPQDVRHTALRAQVQAYRTRCDWMRWATNLGIVSAICFMVALLSGLVEVLAPGHELTTWVGTTASATGLSLVIVAAALTFAENTLSARALDDEVQDIDALKRR